MGIVWALRDHLSRKGHHSFYSDGDGSRPALFLSGDDDDDEYDGAGESLAWDLALSLACKVMRLCPVYSRVCVCVCVRA